MTATSGSACPSAASSSARASASTPTPPRTVIAGREHSPTHQDCLDEMDAFFHGAVAELFARHTSLGLAPRDVDVLVVNVSTFHPAPSFASRIVRAHGMRDDVAAYNLSGMGCAAVDLARSTMHARSRSQSPRRPTLALVVSAECITPNCYAGVDRSMMLGRCLFRCGGSAVLLTTDHRAPPSPTTTTRTRPSCSARTATASSASASASRSPRSPSEPSPPT